MASCLASSNSPYHLNTSISGTAFFDHWHFSEVDYNWGAAWYASHEEAVAEGIIEAHDEYSIVRVGEARYKETSGNWDDEANAYVPGTAGWKRRSARLQTKSAWNYFLVAMHMTHVPVGCGVWPAFWTHSHDVSRGPWPNAGELDMLEYANNLGGKASFHTGTANACTLTEEAVNVCAAKNIWFADLNQGTPNMCANDCTTANDGVCDDGGPNNEGTCDWGSDCADCGARSIESSTFGQCYTDYAANQASLPMELGCAPNKHGVKLTGDDWNYKMPGVLAAEWTEDFVKIFYIPDDAMPQDLLNDAPQPDTWDQYVVSYYPFAASEAQTPGNCPEPERVLGPQHLILNIGLCGDWAGDNFGENAEQCPQNDAGTGHPFYYTQHLQEKAAAVAAGKADTGQCYSELEGRYQTADGGDCCTNFIADQVGAASRVGPRAES
jgi:hypothetical protein